MAFRGPMPFDIRGMVIKAGYLIGILIIVYAVLWMLAELHLIPVIIYAIFPQIVLLCIGIFILYTAYSKRNYY